MWNGLHAVPGLLLAGVRPHGTSIVGSGCFSFVDPAVAVPFVTYGDGHVARFTLRPPLLGHLLLQAVLLWQLPMPVVQSTNSVQLLCH